MTPGKRDEHSDRAPFIVLMPVYDDWDSVRMLLPRLDAVLEEAAIGARILLVDDGSNTSAPAHVSEQPLRCIQDVSVLVLKRNLGHQRALCVGLCAIDQGPDWRGSQGVIVMDADGEDSPTDVPRLVEEYRRLEGKRAVFAQRLRRSEGLIFRVFYQLYRAIHRVLSGVSVQIGNFSVLSRETISRLCVVSELWNHYAAACVHAKLPMAMVPTTRGHRLAGRSRMNFVGLVGHGLSAMSVFGERIGARALITVVVITVALSLITGIAGWLHLIVGVSLPSWGPLAVGIVAMLLMQALLLALVFSFLTHSNRAGGGFLPARDFRWFVERQDCIWSRDERV